MEKANTTLGQRFSYYFDNLISKGTGALFALLGLSFLATSTITAIVAFIVGINDFGDGQDMTFYEAFWISMMHVIDQGTLTADNDWAVRISMVITTFIGMFLVSSLISILNTAFSTKIEQLKKGRSTVIEEEHTIILGWSNKVHQIISELKIAHENQAKSVIVVLADQDIDMMRDEIVSNVGTSGKTRVICRNGNPREAHDLKIVNLDTAKAIIILNPEGSKSDAYVIKTILAIVNNPSRKSGKYNIIAEIKDEVNRKIAKIVGKEEVTVVVSNDIISKMMVQTSRQSGLSLIYNDLIDYSNVEIYILPIKNIEGHTFHDALFAFDDVTVIGIRKADATIMLNPPKETVIGVDDKLILIALDDIELEYDKNRKVEFAKVDRSILKKSTRIKEVQKTLILGWNGNVKIILQELDNYVLPGSEVFIVCETDNLERKVTEIGGRMRNQTLKSKYGDINDRTTLDEIDFGYYDYIIILSYSEQYDIQEADSISLITLMHIRDIELILGKKFNIVSEMLDGNNRALADASRTDDFIISDQIISNVLAQLSENNELSSIFEDLFDADGNEIYLKPALDYAKKNVETSVYSIIEAASHKGEVFIGYRIASQSNNPSNNYGIMLSPNKTQNVKFTDDDKVIVIAEE
ncbi:MAG: hypothetical protein NW207_02165 [Cytophagales bacterium]|nr:hypothetical protein [Cytophagales bacterium]